MVSLSAASRGDGNPVDNFLSAGGKRPLAVYASRVSGAASLPNPNNGACEIFFIFIFYLTTLLIYSLWYWLFVCLVA